MADNITNKDYITITDTKVMVGGKETTKYRGCDIWRVKELPSLFKDIQTKVKQEYGSAPIEMHTLSSEKVGRCAKPGAPSAAHGPNAWVQFVFANGIKTPWVFYGSYSSASDCADSCALDCGVYVQYDFDFLSGVFGAVADAIKPRNAIQTKSLEVGQLIEMGFGNCIMQLKIISIKNKAR